MDAGIALEAVQRYQSLDADLGRLLTSRGNHVHELRPDLLSFPIKQYQWSGADLNIVTRSGHELVELVRTSNRTPEPALTASSKGAMACAVVRPKAFS